jgi:hypothetical protein
LVGDHLLQTFKIANIASAPRGTIFRWDGGLYHDMDAYNVELVATQPEKDSFLVWVQARQPGSTRLRCMVWHETPGGDKGWTQLPDAVVTIPAVSVAKMTGIREDSKGKQSGVLDPLLVGDNVILRFQYANLSSTRTDFPVRIDITGPGREMFNLEKTAQMVAPGLAEVKFKVVKNGPLDVSVKLLPSGVPSDQITQYSLKATVKYVQYGYTDTQALEALFTDIIGDYKYILLQQRDGVERVEKAASHTDAPKQSHSFWKVAAELALTAACFGVGKIVEQYVAGALEHKGIEEKVAEVVGAGLKEATAEGIQMKIKGEADAITSGNSRDIFFDSQKETLNKQARETEQNFNHVGKQAILNSKDPLAQARALKEGQNKAFEQAKTETMKLELDRWASNMARSELGSTFTPSGRMGAPPDASTDLNPVLGATGVGTTIEEEYFGMTREKGVLTVHVEAKYWDQPVKIKSTELHGFTEDLRKMLTGRKIKDLKLPIVVLGRNLPTLVEESGGLKIGRNEVGRITLGSHRGNARAWLSMRAIAAKEVKADLANVNPNADYTDDNAFKGAHVIFDRDLAEEAVKDLKS